MLKKINVKKICSYTVTGYLFVTVCHCMRWGDLSSECPVQWLLGFASAALLTLFGLRQKKITGWTFYSYLTGFSLIDHRNGYEDTNLLCTTNMDEWAITLIFFSCGSGNETPQGSCSNSRWHMMAFLTWLLKNNLSCCFICMQRKDVYLYLFTFESGSI